MIGRMKFFMKSEYSTDKVVINNKQYKKDSVLLKAEEHAAAVVIGLIVVGAVVGIFVGFWKNGLIAMAVGGLLGYVINYFRLPREIESHLEQIIPEDAKTDDDIINVESTEVNEASEEEEKL